MQKSKLQFQNYLLVVSSVFILFAASSVSATEFFFDSETKEARPGAGFQTYVLLNAENEEINAVEGKIIFSPELLELQTIKDGNSFVNFWIEKPKNENGVIIFSGITPGGYKDAKGLIFSVIFRAKKEGEASVEISEAKALLNDGRGTETKTGVKKLLVSIRADISVPSWSVPKDAEPPETFRPEIARDESLFDGKWFLVFATQDKSSGIDHYEVKESRQKIFTLFQKWVLAESPYILADQELRSFIFMKAIDKAGNERIAKINPQNPLGWYENYENWLIIILGLVIAVSVLQKIWQKKKITRE